MTREQLLQAQFDTYATSASLQLYLFWRQYDQLMRTFDHDRRVQHVDFKQTTRRSYLHRR